MLATLARCRRRAPLLERVLKGNRTISADGSSGRGQDQGGKPGEPPMVFTRRREDQRELRYYVLMDKANPALAMLESAARGTPMLSGPGKQPRYARMPPPSVYNSVLCKAAQDSNLASKSAEIAEALLLKGLPLEAHTLKALFGSLAKADALPEALPVLDAWLQQQEDALEADEATQAPLQVMSLLMDTAVRAENAQLLMVVLARMARIGVTPSPQSLTTLLQCFMRLGEVEVAHKVLDWMRRNNLEPNVFSYTALMALPRDMPESMAPRLLEQALSAYSKMREDGVQPNARFFTELIRICGRAGSVRAAEEAWRDAKDAGVHPDLILYSAMIDACAKCKDPGAALRVFEEMKESEVKPDVVAYTSLLNALQGTPQAALVARNLWRSMQRYGVQPNGMAVAAYLEILLAEGEIDEALQTLAQPGGSSATRPRSPNAWQRKAARLTKAAGLAMVTDTDLAVPPADIPRGTSDASSVDLPRLYEHFLFAMAHKGQFAVVEQMARHMRSQGLPHTLGTASALLTAQALQHGHSNAKWLLQAPGVGEAGGTSEESATLPDDVVESCLLGRGSPQACMDKLMNSSSSSRETNGKSSSGGGGGGLLASTRLANVVLGGLAVRGCSADALQLFEWMNQQQVQIEKQQQQQQHSHLAVKRQGPQKGTQQLDSLQAARGSSEQLRQQHTACMPDAWTHQLLLYAALNAPREQQLELTLRAVKEAREFAGGRGGKGSSRSGAGSGGGGFNATGWDRRTRSAVLAVMRQSEKARQLLGAAVDAASEEQWGQVQQLKGMLG